MGSAPSYTRITLPPDILPDVGVPYHEKVALIVEPRSHVNLVPVVVQMSEVYPDWFIYLFHGTDNADFVHTDPSLVGLQEQGRLVLLELGVDNLTADMYNALFTTRAFWEAVNATHALVFQTDAWLCGHDHDHDVDDFLEYDYVGAPARNTHPFLKIKSPIMFQNGGFSLRNVEAMKRTIDACHSSVFKRGEDVFFSRPCKGASNKVAPFPVAQTFVTHQKEFDVGGESPVAMHTPWNFFDDFDFSTLEPRCEGITQIRDAYIGKSKKMIGPIVACCTTLPDRVISGALERSVRSMLSQPHVDELYIFYPRESKRLNKPYPDPPTSLRRMPRVHILRSEDHGPLTKAYPCTDLPNLTPTSGVILFDDDRIYPSNWTSRLVAEFHARDGRDAVGYCGAIPVNKVKGLLGRWNTGKTAYRVGVLQTTFMSMYPRSAFPPNSRACIESLDGLSSAAFTNDDFVLGVWAHRNHVPLVCVPVRPSDVDEFVRVNVDDDARSHGTHGGRRPVRAMIPTDDALTVSSGQKRKQVRLALAYITSNKLPCPVAILGVALSVMLMVVVILIALPLSLTSRRRRRKI